MADRRLAQRRARGRARSTRGARQRRRIVDSGCSTSQLRSTAHSTRCATSCSLLKARTSTGGISKRWRFSNDASGPAVHRQMTFGSVRHDPTATTTGNRLERLRGDLDRNTARAEYGPRDGVEGCSRSDRPRGRAPSRSRSCTPLPRGRRPVHSPDRRSPRPVAGDRQGLLLRPVSC
jgi:hypothetical protein